MVGVAVDDRLIHGSEAAASLFFMPFFSIYLFDIYLNNKLDVPACVCDYCEWLNKEKTQLVSEKIKKNHDHGCGLLSHLSFLVVA